MVKPSLSTKIIGCKWVYKVKLCLDDSIECFNAHLMAKGFHQTHGLDYFETFSPVVKPTTVRIILTLAISFHWTLKQLDVHNDFLNGDLLEDVFNTQSPGFISSQFLDHICKLNKALHGLKQSPRAWYTKLSHWLFEWGFISSKFNTSFFSVHHGSQLTFILVYVDDIIITETHAHVIEHFINRLILSLHSRTWALYLTSWAFKFHCLQAFFICPRKNISMIFYFEL